MTQRNLKKTVTFVQAIAIVVGMIIGSGIFLKPSIVFHNAGSPMLGLLAWIIGGIITMASALTVAEIAAAIPKTGGLYVYLEELYGDAWGFLLGWVQTVISFPAAAAALAIAFSTYTTFFIPLNPLEQKLLAVGVLAFVTVMNILSTKYGGMVQTLSTIAKLIPISIIILWGFINGEANDFRTASVITEGAGFGAAVLGTLWAYDGWISVTNMAGELKNPAKQLPRAIIIGLIIVITVYLLINVALLNIIPIEQITSSETPASEAAVVLFGNGGAAFIAAGIIVSVFGALNGYVMTAARVPFSMGERKQLPYSASLMKLHRRFGTPANALILESALAVIYIFSGTFNTLTDLLVFVLWIFFVSGVFGVFILRRKRPLTTNRYRVPLYPITPVMGILGGVYILISTIISDPVNSTVGIIITLAGLPVYYFTKNR
jgi:APA family basic amino acid/polyamine antiporter